MDGSQFKVSHVDCESKKPKGRLLPNNPVSPAGQLQNELPKFVCFPDSVSMGVSQNAAPQGKGKAKRNRCLKELVPFEKTPNKRGHRGSHGAIACNRRQGPFGGQYGVCFVGTPSGVKPQRFEEK